MKRSGLSGYIQLIFLALILLLLPAYGYACILPMLGSTTDTHTTPCSLIDCGSNGSQENTQKYCDTLKKVELQSSLTLPHALAKITFTPLLLEYIILPGVPKVHTTLSTLEEAKFSTSQNLYLLHHTLLL